MDGYLVTVKLPKNPEHNPRDKQTGYCPVSLSCTDATGEHHTTYVRTLAEVQYLETKFGYITRVEAI